MAINFAGGTDRIAFGSGFNAARGCASAWFKTSQTDANTALMSVWSSTSRNGWGVLLNNVTNKLTLVAGPSNTPSAVIMSSTANLNDGNWHHFAYNWDTTLGNPNYLYIDGVLDITQNATRAWSVGSLENLYFGDNIDPFWASYNGDLAEGAVWVGRHLGAAEIAAIGKGFVAANIAPDVDRFYAPFVRSGLNRADPYLLSQVGTTVTPHPRLFGGAG